MLRSTEFKFSPNLSYYTYQLWKRSSSQYDTFLFPSSLMTGLTVPTSRILNFVVVGANSEYLPLLSRLKSIPRGWALPRGICGKHR